MSVARRIALRETLSGGPERALTRYLSAPARLEARWLVLRVGGVAASAALVSERMGWLGSWAWAAGTAAAVLCYAVPSELGRRWASAHPETLAPTLITWLRPGEWLVAIVADPLAAAASRLFRDDHSRPPNASLMESEVEHMVNAGELDGSLAHDQSQMIRNVLDFGDVTAEEVMVPRLHVHSLDANLPIPEVLATISASQHSRYPVWVETSDNIVGILHVKDLFPALAEGRVHEVSLLELARKPVAFVPEGQLASSVLKDMRAGRHHMAVIIDEFGGVSGIVTLEDLLEEIVGDIQDEHDLEDDRRIHLLAADRALIDASLPITDVNRALGTELPEGDYVSLGGLLLDQLGEVPEEGSTHELLGLSFTVREADARRIAQVEVAGFPPRPEFS
jgi:CBS domain containing-hemolysin-like protein